MAKQYLDDTDVSASLKQVRGEAVPQRMDGDRLAQLGLPCRLPAGLLQRGDAHRLCRIMTGEQPTSPGRVSRQ